MTQPQRNKIKQDYVFFMWYTLYISVWLRVKGGRCRLYDIIIPGLFVSMNIDAGGIRKESIANWIIYSSFHSFYTLKKTLLPMREYIAVYTHDFLQV